MKIGLDLDGVVFDTELSYKVLGDIYNLEVNSKIIDPNEIRMQKKFGWTQEQTKEFIDRYVLEVIEKAPPTPGACEVLKILEEQGHEFYIITSRFGKEVEISKKKLSELGIKISGSAYEQIDKTKACKDFKIDYMIDDYYLNVKQLSENNIKCLFFNSQHKKFKLNENIFEVFDWGDVLNFFIDK